MRLNRHYIKGKFDRHPVLYCTVGATAVAGITVLVMRGLSSQHIDRGIAVVAERGIAVQGKSVVMNNVSYISADRQGPPSWVVRCKETGEIFTSQLSAARELGISATDLSQHLNGRKEHAQGYTFERICMAA